MTLESKENDPRHTKIVQNSLGFMPEVKPLHKPRGDLVLCALKGITMNLTGPLPYSPTKASNAIHMSTSHKSEIFCIKILCKLALVK